MLDGRQVAVLAALTSGDTERATDLLAHTTSGDPWEQHIAACLSVLCRLTAGQPAGQQVADLIAAYLEAQAGHGTTVFDIRLGLTILDAARRARHPATHRLVEGLHRRTMEARDGYAAREVLVDSPFAGLASDRQVQECRELLHACALGSGHFPERLLDGLTSALHTSDRVIRDSLAEPVS